MQGDTSVDDFLQSLGLEKYSITFQAEEVWKSYVSSIKSIFEDFSRTSLN